MFENSQKHARVKNTSRMAALLPAVFHRLKDSAGWTSTNEDRAPPPPPTQCRGCLRGTASGRVNHQQCAVMDGRRSAEHS